MAYENEWLALSLAVDISYAIYMRSVNWGAVWPELNTKIKIRTKQKKKKFLNKQQKS